MSALISSLDKHTAKNLGENGSVQRTWSNDMGEKIVQLFFQLVRTKDTTDIENKLTGLLSRIKGNEQKYLKEFTLLYKLIGQTRDVVAGKGEYSLAYMMVCVWYKFWPELAKNAIIFFVLPPNKDIQHQYGSWKDIKYLCNYVKEYFGNEDHELIKCMVNLTTNFHKSEFEEFKTYKRSIANNKSNAEIPKLKLSLCAKWIPREKCKKFGWINVKIAENLFPQFLKSGKSANSQFKGKLKGRIILRKRLAAMNKHLNTVQVNMCGGNWKDIDFNNVTSLTMRKTKTAFNNKDKQGNQRSYDEDRIRCANNFDNHIKASFSDDTVKIHGKRCNVYELVKDAITTNCSQEIQVINQQWVDNAKTNKNFGNMIAMVDTSSSMKVDDCLPLYNAIGLGIRVSEKSNDAFKHRVLTFNSTVTWFQLNKNASFCDKVRHLKTAPWGGSTNFEAALEMILNLAVANDIPPSEMEDMVMAVFSDMQIDQAGTHYKNEMKWNTMMVRIEKQYALAGLQSKFNTPYKAPHILFWNLRKTNGFPTMSTKKNTTMLSGYSAVLLNIFCEKGVEELKRMTPAIMLEEQLDNERYAMMGMVCEDYVNSL
tara:strand:+ start:148 stop:1932 length:1785 start_codon:yes stop_codon:yes gene_type:complete